jgi:phage FluMu protein Com
MGRVTSTEYTFPDESERVKIQESIRRKMMQLRCYRCGWSFAIGKEEAAFAHEAIVEAGGSHYDVRCPKCRHSNRVSLEQLQRIAPLQPAAEEPEVGATEEEEVQE